MGMSESRGGGRCTVVVLVEVEQERECRTRGDEGKSAREVEGLFVAFCMNAQESSLQRRSVAVGMLGRGQHVQ